jgi:exoribonuclease II
MKMVYLNWYKVMMKLFMDVRQWFINDKVLTVVVDKPIVKVDFGERLKDDIRASIANGDWVPPKLRTLADNM